MTPSRRQVLGAATAAFGSITAQGVSATPRTDAELVEAAFRALHPGLLRYNTEARLAALFGRLRRDLASASDPGRQWLALTTFTAALKCGHTYVNPNNQKGAGEAFFQAGRDRLPFTWRWLDGAMVVGDPGVAEGLAAGDE